VKKLQCREYFNLFPLIVSVYIFLNLVFIPDVSNSETIKTVVISSDDHPPLIQGDESPGKDSGIMTDIVTAAFKSQGVMVQYMSVPAARIVWSLLENKVSATVGPIGWFQRAKAVNKVNYIPIYPASFHFYYLRKRFPSGFVYEKLEDLFPYKIGYMYGGACNHLLDEAGLTVVKVNDRDQNTKKLFLGRIDLMVTESIGGWESIKKLYPSRSNEFSMSDKIIMDAPGCVIFRKEQTELLLNSSVNKEGIEYLKITSDQKISWEAGEIKSNRIISQTIPIYHFSVKKMLIGELQIVVGFDPIYRMLLRRALIILVSNALKTFLVAVFASIIFQLLVSRHLQAIASYIRKVDQHKNEKKLILENKKQIPGRPDEIDQIIEAINSMQLEQKNLVNRLNNEFKTRKKTENSIRESENLFKHVFESANVGKSITSPTGELCVNRSFADMLGYSTEELSNKTWQEITPPMDVEEVKKRIAPLLNGKKKSTRFDKKYIHKNGSVVIADLSVTIRCDANGNPLHFITTIVDITERHRVKKQLRNIANYLQTILKNSPIGIATLKADGQIITTNPSLAKIVGGTVEKIIDLNVNNIESWKKSGMLSDAKKALDKGIPINQDYQYISSFNKECWVSCRFVPFWHESEQQLLLMLTDISESKETEKERQELQSQLRQVQKMESVGRLAGGVAHDYNNALSVIIGYTEMAIQETAQNKQLRDDLNQVLLAANRAADITRQLLAFARKQTIAPKIIDLNENVSVMLKMLHRLIGEDISLVWMPKADIWTIKIDPSQVDQILVNLCVNARDAISGVGKITIETDKIVFTESYCSDHPDLVPGEFIMLAVSDNGCGMDKSILDTIFEPFFTTKGPDEGTGLGLSTVYGIVKQNNGFINVYSESGVGTTIKIYFAKDGSNAQKKHPTPAQDLQIRGNGEQILVVEDDPSILKLSRKILIDAGYFVISAETPKKAIQLVQKYEDGIHLLITDVIMPEMNGLELTHHLLSYYPNLKRIFMSGYTANTIAHHGVLDEDVNFIQKPFSKNDLLKIVWQVLNDDHETHS